jgi:hypothetical protein
MIRVVHLGSRIRMLTFSHPGSRGQKGTQSRIRIPDPDPQHCVKLAVIKPFVSLSYCVYIFYFLFQNEKSLFGLKTVK